MWLLNAGGLYDRFDCIMSLYTSARENPAHGHSNFYPRRSALSMVRIRSPSSKFFPWQSSELHLAKSLKACIRLKTRIYIGWQKKMKATKLPWCSRTMVQNGYICMERFSWLTGHFVFIFVPCNFSTQKEKRSRKGEWLHLAYFSANQGGNFDDLIPCSWSPSGKGLIPKWKEIAHYREY